MSHVFSSRWCLLPALFAIAVGAAAQTASCPSCTPTVCKECVDAGTLRRTKIVNAAFPELARKNGYSGMVELQFTIQPDGTTANIEVLNSNPAGLFEASAIKALSQWTYQPIVRDGEPVAQRAVVRIKFVADTPQTSL